MITQDGYLVNKDEVYTTYKDKTLKESMPNSTVLVNQLKAIKQGFNNSMITNQMSVYEIRFIINPISGKAQHKGLESRIEKHLDMNKFDLTISIQKEQNMLRIGATSSK